MNPMTNPMNHQIRRDNFLESTVMTWVLGLLVCLLFLLPGLSFAETMIVPYPVQRISAAEQPTSGLLKLHLGVLYPNGCFTPNMSSGRVRDSASIELIHYASFFDGYCTQALRPSGSVAMMERPGDGRYTITDATDQRVLGELEMTNGEAVLYPKEDL